MYAVCSDDKHARVGVHQPLYMFVFRVLLGRAYICREPKQFKRPPCTDAGCCSDTCSKHSLYDSVIGTHNFGGSPTTMMGLQLLPLMQAQKVVITQLCLHTNVKLFHLIDHNCVKTSLFFLSLIKSEI